MQVLQHQYGGAPGDQAGDDFAYGAKGRPLQRFGARTRQGTGLFGRRQAHHVGQQGQKLARLAEDRPYRPLQGRAGRPLSLLRRDPHPGVEKLLVEPVGASGSVRGSVPFEPQREPALPAPTQAM